MMYFETYFPTGGLFSTGSADNELDCEDDRLLTWAGIRPEVGGFE